MGEYAEDLINNEMFHRHFPRKKRKGDTSKKNMNGIHKYLKSIGTWPHQHTKIVNAYLTAKHSSKTFIKGTLRQKCIYIQQDFAGFRKWVLENKTELLKL